MEVIPSSALSQDGGALPYAAKVEPVREVLQKPALIPAVKLVEKVCILLQSEIIILTIVSSRVARCLSLIFYHTFSHTNESSCQQSRRSSRASETTDAIVCSPRRASILAAKKNSKGSLNGVERAQEIVSPTTMLRAKIDSLPLEKDDSIPVRYSSLHPLSMQPTNSHQAWGLWKLQTNLSYLHQNSSENSIQTVYNAH